MKKPKKKIRRCLICDLEFLSSLNWICPDCHEKHAKLFESYPGPNYQNLIYSISEEGKGE